MREDFNILRNVILTFSMSFVHIAVAYTIPPKSKNCKYVCKMST